MKGSNARRVAQQALLKRSRIAEVEGGIEVVADRQRVHDLVLGVRRVVSLLDSILDAFLERPSKHLPSPVHTALRMGVYELLFRRGVPVPAVVSETVELLPTRRMKGLGNAVLRRISESFQPLDAKAEVSPRRCVWLGAESQVVFDRDVLPDPKKDLARHLGVHYGQTPWFVSHLEALADDPVPLLRAFNTRLPLTLRPAGKYLGKPRALGDHLRREGVAVLGLRGPVVEVAPPEGTRNWAPLQGTTAVVQDYVPALVAPLLDPQPGERILDLCAAPGGKSIHLAELQGEEGEIVAADVDIKRLALLSETQERLGLGERIRIHNLGPEGKRLPKGPFDRILVDAPCSNSGVLMKRVEARFRLKPNVIKELCVVQERLLERALPLLRPGGHLVYSTCSILREENEALVERFTNRHPEMILKEQHLWLPTKTDRDGGFAALLVHTPS